MSTVEQIVNSVENMFDHCDETPEKVISLILVEKWSHKDYEELEFHDLTNEEINIVSKWVELNFASYDRVAELVSDIQELFHGLTTIAAAWIVAPYNRHSRLRRIR